MSIRNKELTWKPYHGTHKGGRWFRKVDGKRVYFGTARTNSDRAAYQQAEEKFRQFMTV